MKNIIKISKKNITKLPEKSGVYMFRDANDEILYIGKAKNIKSRVKSYFSTRLGRKTKSMISIALSLSYITVNSEIEALLLEAKLVKKHQPKYNIELRDDKSPLYIGITNEEYPRVITLRQTQLQEIKLKKVYGPFLNSIAPKKVLKSFRKIVPFTTHRLGKRGCVYSQIGLCNPCSSVIKNTKDEKIKAKLKAKYSKNVKKITSMLSGKIKAIRADMVKEMKAYSKKQQFESANEIKQKIANIDYILKQHISADSYIENPNLLEDIRKQELDELKKLLKPHIKVEKIKRIECFDVAHLSGSHPAASMVVFINANSEKSLYKHFLIRQKKSQDDVSSMKEALDRRKKHLQDWGKPDLIVVDGGKGQLKAVKHFFDAESIPVVGLAKRFETLVFIDKEGKYREKIVPKGPALNLLQRMRDEAHRFARRLHHKKVLDSIKQSVE